MNGSAFPRPLDVTVCQASEDWRRIQQHLAVCDAETRMLVAALGPAYPAPSQESEQYAALFAAAPKLLAACQAARLLLQQAQGRVSVADYLGLAGGTYTLRLLEEALAAVKGGPP